MLEALESPEFLQSVGIALGLCAFVALILSARRLLRAVDAIWTDCASRYGLRFEEENQGNALTAQRETKRLLGEIERVPVRVHSVRELVGHTRRRFTTFQAHALWPMNERFAVLIARRGTKIPPHLAVPTGDARFDRTFGVRSDSPDLTRQLLDEAVRAALLTLPPSLERLEFAYGQGELSLFYPDTPFRAAELEAPLRALLAMAQVRLA